MPSSASPRPTLSGAKLSPAQSSPASAAASPRVSTARPLGVSSPLRTESQSPFERRMADQALARKRLALANLMRSQDRREGAGASGDESGVFIVTAPTPTASSALASGVASHTVADVVTRNLSALAEGSDGSKSSGYVSPFRAMKPRTQSGPQSPAPTPAATQGKSVVAQFASTALYGAPSSPPSTYFFVLIQR